jgi:hypothetical protein
MNISKSNATTSARTRNGEQRPVVLAVANVVYQSLDFFDYGSGENIGTRAGLIAQPHELTVDNEGRRLFLSHTYRSGAYGTGSEPGHEISIIDVDSRSVVDVIDIHPFVSPHGVRYNAATGLLIASVENSEARPGRGVDTPEGNPVFEPHARRHRLLQICAAVAPRHGRFA